MRKFICLAAMALQASLAFSQPRHIVVAADGSGEFTTAQEAVNSIRAYVADTT